MQPADMQSLPYDFRFIKLADYLMRAASPAVYGLFQASRFGKQIHLAVDISDSSEEQGYEKDVSASYFDEVENIKA